MVPKVWGRGGWALMVPGIFWKSAEIKAISHGEVLMWNQLFPGGFLYCAFISVRL